MLLKFIVVTVSIWLITSHVQAQEKSPVKFGHVSAEDFDISKLSVDTTEGAVIISDEGYSSFEGNSKGWFSLIYKHQRRVRIINKNGFDLANVEVHLYKNGEDEEKLENIKGVSYNLINGNVVETKLDKDAIFTDKYDDKHTLKKFTLPAVKEGTIIEYSYTINSDFLFDLQPWEFQGKFPRVWSEYEVDIPEFFHYVFLAQGYQPLTKKESSGFENYSVKMESNDAFSRPEYISISGNVVRTKWTIQNVPAFKEENFTSTIENHISLIQFQMSGIQFPNEPYEDVMGSWISTNKKLLERDDFGYNLDRNNGWLNDDMKIITLGAKDNLDKAKKIYYYVKDNIKSTDQEGILMKKSLKEVFKSKSGSVADINLLLVAMLRHENIAANPVILSTRSNGYTYTLYPILDRYNYVICKASIDTNSFLLDATKTYLGFGLLPVYCYNDYGRTVNNDATLIPLSPDSLQEPTQTNVLLSNDSSGNAGWTGSFYKNTNFDESNNIREEIASDGKENYMKKVAAAYSDNMTVSDIELTGLEDYESPLEVNYSIKIDGDSSSDVIYFNPVFNNKYKENPLKAADRKYPVEMPYPIDDSYNVTVAIPKGYEIDELPKSAKVSFNDGQALFEYYVYKDQTTVSLQSHLKFIKATFTPEDYQDLRSFFDYIVKKNSEQFVFKKKK